MEDNSIYQYIDCTLENLITILKDCLSQEVLSNSNVSNLCSEDVREIEKIQKEVQDKMGVTITCSDIINAHSVEELYQVIKLRLDTSHTLMTEKDKRREDLLKMAQEKNLMPFTGTLEKAEDKLRESLKNIQEFVSPLEKMGVHTKWDTINTFLNKCQVFVRPSELKGVIAVVDENNRKGFENLGTAIEATNNWLNALCEALVWIIQIENDLYDISEETSSETLRIGKLLSKEGDCIDGLADIAALEKVRRQRMQQKIKDFKADVEGKIEFLNRAHQKLKLQFEEYQNSLNSTVENHRNELKQQIENCIRVFEEKLKVLSETMKKEQSENLQQMRQQYAEETNKINELIKQNTQKEQTFINTQTTLMATLKKQITIYKIISVCAVGVSIATIIYTILT